MNRITGDAIAFFVLFNFLPIRTLTWWSCKSETGTTSLVSFSVTPNILYGNSFKHMQRKDVIFVKVISVYAHPLNIKILFRTHFSLKKKKKKRETAREEKPVLYNVLHPQYQLLYNCQPMYNSVYYHFYCK